MSASNLVPQRQTNPTAPDLEACQPLLSRTSTLQDSGRGQQIPIFTSDKGQGRRGFWSNWSFRLDARIVSDAILGLSDGLTVPFALTAGLTALGDTKVVILGGLAELIAGAISMGLGGYVGAKSEIDSYEATDRQCNKLILHESSSARDCVQDYFEQFGLSPDETKRVADHIKASNPMFKDFLMQNHFHAAKPDTSRPYLSALVLGFSYFIGGFIPLVPYFFVARDDVWTGLMWSIGVMCVILLVFGYVKTGVVRGWSGRENYQACSRGSMQMLVVGAIACGSAVLLVRLINQN